jgi:hypothetical protein
MNEILNITATDIAAVLRVETLYPQGVELVYFAQDQAISVASAENAEVRMGVDGKMAAGFIPYLLEVTINLEANSPSARTLGRIFEAQRKKRGVYSSDLIVTIPSEKNVYSFTGGVLKNGVVMPDIKKALEPTAWVYNFPGMDRSEI